MRNRKQLGHHLWVFADDRFLLRLGNLQQTLPCWKFASTDTPTADSVLHRNREAQGLEYAQNDNQSASGAILGVVSFWLPPFSVKHTVIKIITSYFG